MSLTAADVAEILRLVEGSSFDEFSLELDGLKLNFKRSADGSVTADPPADAALPPPAVVAPSQSPAAVAAVDLNLHNVKAPLLGTFYRAPKPGEPAYVAVGDVVERDTIVGIIEVMKLMNTVRAEASGTVAEILVADGAFVEYGEILLRIAKPV